MWQRHLVVIFSSILVLFFSNSDAVSSFTKNNPIHFDNNGYEDVIVSIHPDVSDISGDKIIDGIKSFISDGSQKLYQATKGRTNYLRKGKKATTVLPANDSHLKFK